MFIVNYDDIQKFQSIQKEYFKDIKLVFNLAEVEYKIKLFDFGRIFCEYYQDNHHFPEFEEFIEILEEKGIL